MASRSAPARSRYYHRFSVAHGSRPPRCCTPSGLEQTPFAQKALMNWRWNGGGRGFHFVCFMYFVVMLSNLKRSFQRRTILNHDAHRLVCLVRILGLEIIPLVMLAAEKSETSSWSWQDSYAEVDAKGDLKW